jgi:hypothetical protein
MSFKAEFEKVQPDPPLIARHRVIHRDPAAHQLHQVLVARDHGDLGGPAGIGGDQVVGLEEFSTRVR